MLVLDLDAVHAVYLVAWIKAGRRQARIDGLAVPPGLDQLEQVLAEQANLRGLGPERVTEGQAGSIFDPIPQDIDSELVTYEAAARRLRCSVSTIKRRVRSGDLVPVKHGRIARLRIADLDQLGA